VVILIRATQTAIMMDTMMALRAKIEAQAMGEAMIGAGIPGTTQMDIMTDIPTAT
jgi:hypothetical protein